ncbi:MAG TPA: DUF2865 domain-containing protein [Roseiarcus sp.]|nr:DUF2865 domain-containing protein [Roseiarcus sp.]
MTNETRGGARRRRARTAWAAAAAALLALAAGDAGAQDAQYCQQLRAQIAAAGQTRSGPAAAYDAAAQKQKAEIDKTIAYSRQIGCENRKFLFFGKDPPAQCGALYAQIARMQANLGQLQARGSGGGGEARAQLVARYQSECEQTRPRGFFEALFGNPREEPSQRVTDVPLVPDPNAPGQPGDNTNPTDGVQAHAGSKEVCVRTCDGYFFPIGYSGSGGHSGDLQEMCRALCPNAETALYSYSPAGDISQAVGADGTRYADLPNALKYRKSLDPTCTCRRRGQSWAQALADAEALLGERKTDIIVTQQKSDEMSRARPDPKAKPSKAQAAEAAKNPPPPADAKNPPDAGTQDPNNPTDALLGEQPTPVSRENSGIASGDAVGGPNYSKAQGQVEEVAGPDGVKRRVRIIDPTL